MVLAAGRGERLKPLTDRLPKPLVPVNAQPLLVHHLKKLAAAEFDRVIINLGWLGEQIPIVLGQWLDTPALSRLEVIYSQEPPGALETAGGIRHAIEYFEDEPFAVISSDVLSDFDYKNLQEHALAGLGHLVLVDNPPHHPSGDFSLFGDRVVSLEVAGDDRTSLTYAGFGLFSPSLFHSLPPGHRPLRPALDQAIDRQALTGEHFGGRWLDIGTVERLASAQAEVW